MLNTPYTTQRREAMERLLAKEALRVPLDHRAPLDLRVPLDRQVVLGPLDLLDRKEFQAQPVQVSRAG